MAFIILLVVGLWASPGFAQKAFTSSEFPNPQQNSSACGRGSTTSYVCDPGNQLTSDQATKLDTAISDIQSLKDCICDSCSKDAYVQVAVAVVPSINKTFSSEEQMLEATMEFANYLEGTGWNFAECENDIVIVVAIAQMQTYTAAGEKAIELGINTDCANEVFEAAKSDFRNNDYGAGILTMVEAYKSALEGEDYCLTTDNSLSTTTIIIIAVVIGVVVLIAIGCACFCCLCRAGTSCLGGGGGGGYGGGGHHHHDHHHHHHDGHHGHGGYGDGHMGYTNDANGGAVESGGGGGGWGGGGGGDSGGGGGWGGGGGGDGGGGGGDGGGGGGGD